jgi:acyl carrier protein phosphodiesterase
MNYLAHAFLARPDPARICGALIADFAKGIALDELPEAIREGVVSHRSIDVATDSHPVVVRARARFEPPLRRFAGIALDVVFDHFLARDFDSWSSDGLSEFTQSVYVALETHAEHLPERLARVRPRMVEDDWLASYADLDNVGRALRGISRRLRRANPLDSMMPAIERNYREIEADFAEFFPDLVRHAAPTATAW